MILPKIQNLDLKFAGPGTDWWCRIARTNAQSYQHDIVLSSDYSRMGIPALIVDHTHCVWTDGGHAMTMRCAPC